MAIYQHISIYGIVYLDPEQKKIVCALWLILQWLFEQFHLKKADKKVHKRLPGKYEQPVAVYSSVFGGKYR